VHSSLITNVPQGYANVDRDKVLKQEVDLEENAFMGTLLVNYFNRFGRQWQVYVGAEGEYRRRAEEVGQFYVRNRRGQMVPLSTLVSLDWRAGPEYTNRFNEYRGQEPLPGCHEPRAQDAVTERAARPGGRRDRRAAAILHGHPGFRRPTAAHGQPDHGLLRPSSRV
jgi:AcrB/AcrD/AcrF family